MLSQKDDLVFGAAFEHLRKNDIEKIVGTEIDWVGGYSTFDFKNKSQTVFIELKSRRIKHDDYPTAIIGLNKVRACADPTKSYWFFFNYTDGLYYIRYNESLFNTFRTMNNYMRGDRVGCLNTPQDIVHIPVENLTKY
jgi:hypothetical protein